MTQPQATTLQRPQIHGHRGCRGLFPENTLPAFLHALRLGVDVLEMDVVLSADQQVVVAHEPWLAARLGLSPDGQLIDPVHERDYNIYQLPYAIVRQSVVGKTPDLAFPGQQLVATYRPLLSEVLHLMEEACHQISRPPIGYSIEIKSTPETEGLYHPSPEVFTAVVIATIPVQLRPRVTLLCFDARILQVAHQLAPELRLCLLVEKPFEPESLFNELGFEPAVFGPDYQLLSPATVARLRQLYPHTALVPWTVNEPIKMQELIKWQVDGFTTDYPNAALVIL